MFVSLGGLSYDAAELGRLILIDLAAQLNAALKRIIPSVRTKLAIAIERAISNAPEYQSLIGGRLQAELGVTDPDRAMRSIIKAIVSGIQIEHNVVRPVGGSLEGGMTISILKDDLSEVLSLPAGSFVSERHYRIDWLDWLLTKGDAYIIADYEFVPGDFISSRTRLGLMRKARQGWRVPPEFAGVVHDNFLTRALSGLEQPIEDILREELTRTL